MYSDSNEGVPNEKQKLMQFLMGLNDTYTAIRNQILLQIPLPTLRQSYASITQAEKQIQISSVTNESIAPMAFQNTQKQQYHSSFQGANTNNMSNNSGR